MFIQEISFYLKSNGSILNNNNNVVSLELSRFFHVLTDKYIYTMCYTYKLKRNKKSVCSSLFSGVCDNT